MVVGIGLDRAVLMVSLLGQAEQKVRINLSQPPGLIGLTPRKRMLWFPLIIGLCLSDILLF